MNKKLIEQFKEDTKLIYENNLSYDSIEEKINKNILNNESYMQKYRAHKTNNKGFVIRHWKLVTAITSILLVVSLSVLLLFIDENSYLVSPYSDQLNNVVFGAQAQNINFMENTFSDYIDRQHDNSDPLYFYETKLNEIDNYYTCAYYPSKYKEELNLINITDYLHSYNSSNDIIDGKLIYLYNILYKDYLNEKNYNIKWYQIPVSEDIPLTIDNYSLGLILSSRDVQFIENKTNKTSLNFTKKIFIRNYFNTKTRSFENDDNYNAFMLEIKGNHLISSSNNISDSLLIEDINFIKSFELNNNSIIIQTHNNYSINILGHYQKELEEIQTKEHKTDIGTYGEFDYSKFCDLFF